MCRYQKLSEKWHRVRIKLTNILMMKGETMDPRRAIIDEIFKPRERTFVGKSSEDARYKRP